MAEMETIRETVTVLEERVEYLKDGIAKINRKAAKLGCEPLKLSFDGSTRKQLYVLRNGRVIGDDDLIRFPAHSIKRTYFTIDATLEYIIPVIDGWELITTFDVAPRVPVKNATGGFETDADGNTVYSESLVFTSTVPGKELPAEFLDKNEIHCDHCGSHRFRTHSMLMRNVDTGEYKEVGSTCVRDFFGHDPKGLLWMSQLSFSDMVRMDEEDFRSGGGSETMYLDTLLQWTALAIRLEGWVSKKYARDYEKTSTVETMYFYMDPPKNFKGTPPEPTEEDVKLANDTIKHFTEMDPEGNDYLANCCKVVKLGFVPEKMVGVACSMIASYKKFYKDYLERKNRLESNWVGEPFDKIEVDVLCVFSKELCSDWGVSVLYIFIDEDTGNKFKTYYSGSKWTVYQGDKMTLKGTIKRLEIFKSEKVNNLTRCSVTNVVEAPVEEAA